MFLILKNKKPWFISSSILRQTAISIKRGKVNEKRSLFDHTNKFKIDLNSVVYV